MADYEDTTVKTYDKNADDYASRQIGGFQAKERRIFAEKIKAGGKLLDLGCGPGTDAVDFMQMGLEVLAVDGSEAMVELAKKRGVNAVKLKYSELATLTDKYDGVWSSYSLLHVPKEYLVPLLKLIKTLMKPEALIYASFRTGEGEELREEDRYGGGRFFAYYNEEEIKGVFGQVWQKVETGSIEGAGEKGGLYVTARD